MLKLVLFAAVTANVISITLAKEFKCSYRRRHEVYSSCVNDSCFGARKCSEIGRPEICVLLEEGACREGYVCKRGFLRNNHGVCIPAKNCPKPEAPCCGELEVADPCINGGCFKERYCSDIIRPTICVDPRQCKQGCLCKEGYLRNVEGKCIPKNQCPEKLKCPRQNEVYDPCVDSCNPGTCESIGKQYNCPLESANATCTGGCVCEPGFFRSTRGNCISQEDCAAQPLECDSNEIQDDCPAFCKAYSCPKSVEESRAPCKTPDPCPAPSCKSQCRFNFRRSDNGTCIPTRDCPPFDCGPYEKFDPCPPLCPTDDCSQATPDGRCPLFGRIGIVLECSPTCRCIRGYWRKNGVCVPYAQCDRTITDSE